MKRSETHTIAEVLQAFLEQEPDLHEHLLEAKAVQVVHQILGPALAPYIGRVEVSEGVLRVRVLSGAVAQQILLLRSTLLSRINEMLGVELLREVYVQH